MQNLTLSNTVTVWRLQDAKAQFSELVNSAMRGVPQHVTRSGKRAVVILSEQDFEFLQYNAAHPVNKTTSFVDHLMKIPKSGISAVAELNAEVEPPRLSVQVREVDFS